MHFPVSYSTLSDKALNEYILNQYGFQDSIETTYLLRGMNDTYLVNTPKKKYIFRVYRGDWRKDISEVAFEIELLQFLDQQGISVSLPVIDNSREYIQVLHAPEGIRYGVLFDFAEGTERGIDHPDISFVFGKAVAEMHVKSDGFHSNHSRQRLDLNYLIHEPLKIIESCMKHREEDYIKIKTVALRLEELLHEQTLENLEWGICHGDLHGNTNISYKDDMSYTHYDFDLCGYGWRAYDIAEFRLAREVRLGHDSEKLEQLWSAFIEGYNSVKKLKERDLESIPIFVGIRQLWLMSLCLKDPSIEGSIDYGDDFITDKLSYFNTLKIVHEGGIIR